jgi:AGCS family alanine or glycine:cation symporter
MDLFSLVIDAINDILKWPLIVGLLGTGLFLTLRLGFVQFRRFGHGVAVTTGKYDDPDEPGDVSHFQALTTALSATVGVGNIAGVAMAVHIGGPGAVFWMWVTALLGMATKYSEVTLAQQYREVVKPDLDAKAWEGSVSGGPMYYIERGLTERFGIGYKGLFKGVAIFFAAALMLTSFMTGNAVQANTIATQVADTFGVAPWVTGLTTALIVGVVILGGISRIGKVTSIVAPVMAAVYVLGALVILGLNIEAVPSAFGSIFSEAFNPTAGIAGTGIGLFLQTLTYGVQRGLFSNEAGQGSAPIAHSAAKTDEPVSEGVVALLEPFIDTIVICTITALVIISTGVFSEQVDTVFRPGQDANITYLVQDDTGAFARDMGSGGFVSATVPGRIEFVDGRPVGEVGLGYLGIGVDQPLYADAERTELLDATLVLPRQAGEETDANRPYFLLPDGSRTEAVYGLGYRNSSPLTTLAFERGLEPVGLGGLGRLIVLVSVVLFAVSTSISWSYYGDRCANYIFGPRAILPFKFVFVVMHFVGATLAVTTIWDLGDVALSLVTLPNVISLLLLSGVLATLTNSYFERRPWEENEVVATRVRGEKRAISEQKRAEREAARKGKKGGPGGPDAPRA